jgi:ATP-binding cassette subfamily F protein uup
MSERPTIISTHSLHKTYLERVILQDVTFAVHEGERVALLGANGAGKSTLLGILTGTVTPDRGEVRIRRDTAIAYLHQEGGLQDEWTVSHAIDTAFSATRALQAELDDVHHALEKHPPEEEMNRLLRRQTELHHELEHRDYLTIESRKSEAMRALGVPPADRIIGELSGGERRRTALCRTILQDADLLLLDEPTNHLDAETLDWLEEFLARFRGTVVLVTHDRYFLDNVATKMIEVSRGVAQVYPGNYSDYLMAKQEEMDRAQQAEATRQNLLRREIDWLRRQPKARTTKSKARIDRAHDLINAKPLAPDPGMQLLIPSGPRLGKTLIEAEDVNYSIAGRPLIHNFTFTLGPGDRVGVVGRNGLGKTTLLRLLMGELEPESGRLHRGVNVKFVYADQSRKSLDLDKTVLEEVAGELEYVTIGGERIGFRSWLARFQFTENQAAMPINLLSGGERNRVQLAKMLREGGNVVVLDEPTNDLDLPTLRILEEALVRFEGCAFVVSHDRYFLNRVATRIIAFHDGEIVVVEGNYDHYRSYLEREQAARDAEQQPSAPEPGRAEKKAERPKEQKKLGYNEQREFEAMETRIMEAEARAEELDARMQNPDTFTKLSKEELAQLVKDHDAAKAEVERLYERWAELSERAR